MRRAIPPLASALLALALALPSRGDVVERRGAEPALEGEVDPREEGVRVRTDQGAEILVPWDRVRAIHASDPSIRAAWERHRDEATTLWRARSRVERHDVALAEPDLARLFERSRGATHETARVVAEGLLRCRLARGAQAEALIPALETLRLERAGVTTMSYADLPQVLDAATGLCPQLAPWWDDDRALAASERGLAAYAERVRAADALVAAIAERYRAIARRRLEVEALPPTDAPETASDALDLLDLLLRCAAPDDAVRREATATAAARVNGADSGTWREAWLRAAIGEAMLEESGAGRRRRGIVELLNVPARFGSRLPWLAGRCLAVAAAQCEAEGFAAGADSLRAELAARWPAHPVLLRPELVGRSTKEPS